MYNVPYAFILKALYPIRPTIKKALGGYFLFVHKKLLIFLRERDTYADFNGVFVAVLPEYLSELEAEINLKHTEFDLDGTKDGWLFINEDLDDFETKCTLICEMIKQTDTRIGR